MSEQQLYNLIKNSQSDACKFNEIKNCEEKYTFDYYYHQMKKFDWLNTKNLENNSAIENLQFNLNCCGHNGPQDWDKIRPASLKSNVYPLSCCGLKPHYDNINWCIQPKTEVIAKLTSIIVLIINYYYYFFF